MFKYPVYIVIYEIYVNYIRLIVYAIWMFCEKKIIKITRDRKIKITANFVKIVLNLEVS